MPEEEKYIIASCSISRGLVHKAGELFFHQADTDSGTFLDALYRRLNLSYSKFHKMDSLSKLGLLAAEILLHDYRAAPPWLPEQISVVLLNANSSLDADLKYWQSVKNMPSPALFVYTLPNIVIGEICIRNHFKGENAFFIQPVFDASFLQFYVNRLFEQHATKLSVCGWVDILGEDYKAVLYLVSESWSPDSVPFTIDHLNTIYAESNG